MLGWTLTPAQAAQLPLADPRSGRQQGDAGSAGEGSLVGDPRAATPRHSTNGISVAACPIGPSRPTRPPDPARPLYRR